MYMCDMQINMIIYLVCTEHEQDRLHAARSSRHSQVQRYAARADHPTIPVSPLHEDNAIESSIIVILLTRHSGGTQVNKSLPMYKIG